MTRKAALLWDESYIWGIMSIKALTACGLPFDIIRAEDMSKGLSRRYALLFIPGGWASNKIKALGESGIKAIKDFVGKGGMYLGLCGGAGLATLDGIGLLQVKRMPTALRVPSLSGKVLAETAKHPVFDGVKEKIFHVWWPSQFIAQSDNVATLAYYKEVFDESFSSDLPVGTVRKYGQWAELEQRYGINLDPARVTGSPILLEGSYGDGKVLLSLIHFDTIGDMNGQQVLKNLWGYAGITCIAKQETLIPRVNSNMPIVDMLENAVEELITYGINNFLWFWRNPMLLQWRRGIRGLECCNLCVMVKELCGLIRTLPEDKSYEPKLIDLKLSLFAFLEDLKRLLFLERQQLHKSQLTYVNTDNECITALRDALFSRSKSYGGKYKSLLGQIDALLYHLVKQGISMKD